MTDLEAMLRAGAEVRDVARKRALVLDGARDALGDFNRFLAFPLGALASIASGDADVPDFVTRLAGFKRTVGVEAASENVLDIPAFISR